MPEKDLPTVMLTVVIVFMILWVGTYALNATLTAGGASVEYNDPVIIPGDNSQVTIADRIGKNEEVVNSRGIGVYLRGVSDSTYKTTDDITVASDKTWSASTWASVDPASENETMSAVSGNGRVVIGFDGTADNWTVWYYDEADRDSYQANITAPDQPGNLTNIQVTRNATNLTIYRNQTRGEVVDLTVNNTHPVLNTSQNWHGAQDEVRFFDSVNNNSQRNALYNQPVRQLPNASRSARMMFDERGETIQLLFFAAGNVKLSNVGFVDTLPGDVMQGESIYNSITSKTDYEWDVVGPTVRVTESGELDGAPVLYVTYASPTQLGTLADDWIAAMQLAAVLLMLVPLGAIFLYLRETR